jgi:hypothetical protein
MKMLSCQMLPDLKKKMLFGSFPRFAHLSFWSEQHVDEG